MRTAKYSRAVVKIADELGISCAEAVRLYQRALRLQDQNPLGGAGRLTSVELAIKLFKQDREDR